MLGDTKKLSFVWDGICIRMFNEDVMKTRLILKFRYFCFKAFQIMCMILYETLISFSDFRDKIVPVHLQESKATV